MILDGVEITPMTEQENIRRLAELAGYSKTGMGGFWLRIIPAPDGEAMQTLPPTWNPFTSRDHCAMLEDEVERRGIKEEYSRLLLIEIFGTDGLAGICLPVIWDIATAKAPQRCQALLRLIEGKEVKP